MASETAEEGVWSREQWHQEGGRTDEHKDNGDEKGAGGGGDVGVVRERATVKSSWRNCASFQNLGTEEEGGSERRLEESENWENIKENINPPEDKKKEREQEKGLSMTLQRREDEMKWGKRKEGGK